MDKKKLEKLLIEISLKIARQGKGCMFVIKENGLNYDLLVEQDVKSFKIDNNHRRLELLALFDGAVIIDKTGKMIAYAAQIKNTKPFRGYGTRHSAAYTASKNGNTVILASEEDRKVRIFGHGKMIMQLDSLEKDIDKKTNQVVTILESIGAGSLATIGAAVLLPAIGVTLIPGIIIFGSSHFIFKNIYNKIKGIRN